jgi:hypothetical protein
MSATTHGPSTILEYRSREADRRARRSSVPKLLLGALLFIASVGFIAGSAMLLMSTFFAIAGESVAAAVVLGISAIVAGVLGRACLILALRQYGIDPS